MIITTIGCYYLKGSGIFFQLSVYTCWCLCSVNSTSLYLFDVVVHLFWLKLIVIFLKNKMVTLIDNNAFG